MVTDPKWLDHVEASVEEALSALVGTDRSSLLRFPEEIETALSVAEIVTPEMITRLTALRERTKLLQVMIRQAAAFERGREQLETGSVLGYTPSGLERAL